MPLLPLTCCVPCAGLVERAVQCWLMMLILTTITIVMTMMRWWLWWCAGLVQRAVRADDGGRLLHGPVRPLAHQDLPLQPAQHQRGAGGGQHGRLLQPGLMVHILFIPRSAMTWIQNKTNNYDHSASWSPRSLLSIIKLPMSYWWSGGDQAWRGFAYLIFISVCELGMLCSCAMWWFYKFSLFYLLWKAGRVLEVSTKLWACWSVGLCTRGAICSYSE